MLLSSLLEVMARHGKTRTSNLALRDEGKQRNGPNCYDSDSWTQRLSRNVPESRMILGVERKPPRRQH